MFTAFKIKLYYFSKAVILVKFYMKFGVLGILCRISISYSVVNYLNANFSILIIWIQEESSDCSVIDRGFRPGLTQIGLYNHRRWVEA